MSENKETERNLEEIPADAAEPETMAEEIPEQSEKNLKGNYKTLQQLSVEYGITRQGMKVRLDKMLAEISEKGLNKSDYVSRGVRNTIYVLEPGLIWLAKFDADNSPMRPPVQNIDLELYKLEKAETRTQELEKQVEDQKRYIDFLQSQLSSRSEQVDNLTETVLTQTNTIENYSKLVLMLTQKQPAEATETEKPAEAETEPKETATEPPQNAPQEAETPVSISEDKLKAEVAKKSFWGKLALLFG